jgi:hypothetical protein
VVRLVVGNPPYIRLEDVPDDRVRVSFSVAEVGRMGEAKAEQPHRSRLPRPDMSLIVSMEPGRRERRERRRARQDREAARNDAVVVTETGPRDCPEK